MWMPKFGSILVPLGLWEGLLSPWIAIFSRVGVLFNFANIFSARRWLMILCILNDVFLFSW